MVQVYNEKLTFGACCYDGETKLIARHRDFTSLNQIACIY
jgi:hypothetical protein